MEESTTRLLQIELLNFRWTTMPTLKSFDPFNQSSLQILPFLHKWWALWVHILKQEDLEYMAQGYHKFEVLSFWHQEFKQASPNDEMLAKYPKACCIIGLGLKSSEEFLILKAILWFKRMKIWLQNFSLFAKD